MNSSISIILFFFILLSQSINFIKSELHTLISIENEFYTLSTPSRTNSTHSTPSRTNSTRIQFSTHSRTTSTLSQLHQERDVSHQLCTVSTLQIYKHTLPTQHTPTHTVHCIVARAKRNKSLSEKHAYVRSLRFRKTAEIERRNRKRTTLRLESCRAVVARWGMDRRYV